MDKNDYHSPKDFDDHHSLEGLSADERKDSWVEDLEPIVVFGLLASIPLYAFLVFELHFPIEYFTLILIVQWIVAGVFLRLCDIAFIDGHQPMHRRRYRWLLWPNRKEIEKS